MQKNKMIVMLVILFILFYFTCSIFMITNYKNSINNNNNATQTQIINFNNLNNEQDKININTCSREALISLPNIKDKLADRIISGRPYKDIWELDKIDGIGTNTILAIEDRVVCK